MDDTRTSLKLVTPPALEPLTRADVLAHLRLCSDDSSAELTRLLKAAREYVEGETWRQLLPATWRYSLDRFPCWEIELPRAPLASVTSITYIDTNGTTQTLSGALYKQDTDSEPGRVTPAYGQSWPSTRCEMAAVKITYVAGYASAALVPEQLKVAILELVGHLYENREAVNIGNITSLVPLGFENLIARYKAKRFL